jgi:hypothetical protein
MWLNLDILFKIIKNCPSQDNLLFYLLFTGKPEKI